MRAGQLEAALNINETANALEQRGIAKIWVRDIAGTDITFAFRDKLLAQAMADALTAIRADGTYDKLFDKFGMTKLKSASFAIRGDGPYQLTASAAADAAALPWGDEGDTFCLRYGLPPTASRRPANG